MRPIFSRRDLTLLALGAVGFWLGFPNALLHIPPLVLACPLALALLGQKAENRVDALAKGWLTGLIGASAALYWLALPVHEVGGMPWVLAAPCAIAIGAYVGLYAGFFSVCAFTLRRLPPLRQCVALGVLWYALELLRGSLFTGFPWLSLATAFAPWPFMIQGASLVGGYALGGLLVCCTLLMATALQGLGLRHALLGGSGLLLMAGLGLFTLAQHPRVADNDSRLFPLLMVEGNIDQNLKWESALQQATVESYIKLSREGLAALAAKAGKNLAAAEKESPARTPLVIWPETAMPFYFDRHPKFGPMVARFAQEAEVALVLGAPGAVPVRGSDAEIFNRAYLLDTSGRLAGYYDKTHLVPFGEYLPPWLAFDFLKPLLQGVGNFTPGRAAAPLRTGDLALGMLICYESIFPEIARQRVADGANVLLNISNDGWFGDSAAPEQHLQLAILRAVEQNRWLIRSTNTGISAIADPRGRIVLRGQQFRAQSLPALAGTEQEKSIYYALHPWLPVAAALLLVLVCLPYGWRKN